MDAIICLLDRDDDGTTTNAFKTILPDGDVNDFTVASYALTLTLEEEKKAEEVLNIEIEAPAPAPAAEAAPAPVAEAAAPAPAEAAPAAAAPAAQTGDFTAVAVLAAIATLGTAVIISKKH